jgi:hypothetical protein
MKAEWVLSRHVPVKARVWGSSPKPLASIQIFHGLWKDHRAETIQSVIASLRRRRGDLKLRWPRHLRCLAMTI